MRDDEDAGCGHSPPDDPVVRTFPLINDASVLHARRARSRRNAPAGGSPPIRASHPRIPDSVPEATPIPDKWIIPDSAIGRLDPHEPFDLSRICAHFEDYPPGASATPPPGGRSRPGPSLLAAGGHRVHPPLAPHSWPAFSASRPCPTAAFRIMRSVMAEPSLLSLPAFRNFWFGRLATTAANQIFSLVIGWELYEITGSAWYLGMAGLVQFLPVLVSFAIAGDLADRLDRRKILVTVSAGNAVLGAILWGASLNGMMSVELLLGVSVFVGLLRPFQMSSTQALTALLVPPILLTRAIALGSGGSQAMFIAAPALAGFVLIAGPVYVYALLTLVALTGSVCFFLARYRFIKPEPRPFSLAQLLGGFAFLWRERALFGVISLDLFAVMLASVTALLPVFAKDVLQVDAWGLGLLRAAPAVGAVLMSVVLAKWAIQRRAGKLMLGNVALFSIALLGFAFSESLWLSLLLLAVSGGADMVSVVIRQTMLQIDTPDDMRGRVSAVSSLAISGSNQLGDFRAGLAAYWLGVSGAVASGAVAGVLVALLWIRWFPEIWQRERLDQRQQD
jgi:MFS family permease